MAKQETIDTYKEPLRPLTKGVLLATVIFFHVGGGYALTLIQPAQLVVGDTAPMEVSPPRSTVRLDVPPRVRVPVTRRS